MKPVLDLSIKYENRGSDMTFADRNTIFQRSK
jgi:hypothetical protein